MKIRLNLLSIAIISLLAFNVALSQNRFLQIDINGGLTKPVGSFSNQYMFAGNGYHVGGSFDYFFNNIGLGVAGGYFTNNSRTLFNDYIQARYYETPISGQTNERYNTKYLLVGPTYKFSMGRFEIDLFAKAGVSQIDIPNLIFTKQFFNQTYDVYHFIGETKDYQMAWSVGSRFIYKINSYLGLQGKADIVATNYMSKLGYDNSYRNASDGNRNGIMEDSEYFESPKVQNAGSTDLLVMNLNLGLIVQLGKPSLSKVKMIPNLGQEISNDKESVTKDQSPIQPELSTDEPKEVKSDELVTEAPSPELSVDTILKVDEIPVTIKDEMDDVIKHEAELAKIETIQIPTSTYDAPESEYDKEAAEFLYKAGESYFATNDYENALPCFNKLKGDVNYPRAKYMFALSLCALGNCEEGKKEYKEFTKTYKEADARTLEVIFASQFEKCAYDRKSQGKNSSKEKNIGGTNNVPEPVLTKEFRIQFIAIRKPDATFPGVSKVGKIETEFFPNKSVYRYTLSGYGEVEGAAIDLGKVRKMGFRDAFIAVYENGKRVNTIYHKR